MAPFPCLPMAAIVASLVSEKIIQMSVFAYAGFMVEHLGVVDDKDKAGYYAGVLSSSYVMGRFLSSQFWGLVSDRHGCRFVIAFGLSSSAVLSVAFGCSTTFASALVTRFLIGLLNGMSPASKTLVAEVCGPEHNTVGMGLTTSAWSLGAVLGPGIGGMLVDPAKHHPRTFSEHGVFGRNPYLLANLVGAGLALLALPLVFIFLDTKHARSSSSNLSTTPWYSSWCFFGGISDYEYHASATDGTDAESGVATGPPGGREPSWIKPWTTFQIAGKNRSPEEVQISRKTPKYVKPESLLAQRHIRILMLINAVYSVSYSGFNVVFTLWALSSGAKGGLDWSSLHIGQVFFACGIVVLVFEVLAVPYLTPWLGIRTSQRLGSIFEVPVYFLVPLISVLNVGGLPATVASLILLFTVYVCTDSFYVAICLAVNNATAPERRGELNGLSTTVSALSTIIAPIVCSALFAFSINGNHAYPFNYHLTFYLLAISRLASACMGWNTITDADYESME